MIKGGTEEHKSSMFRELLIMGYTDPMDIHLYTAPVPKARRTSQKKSQEAYKRTSKKSYTMCFLAILEKLQT